MPLKLRIDDEFVFYGVKYSVQSIDPPYIYYQRIDGDRKIERISLQTLISDFNFKVDVQFMKQIQKEQVNRENKYISVYDTLSENDKETVKKRYKMIEPLLLLEKVKSGDLVSSIIMNEHYGELLKSDNESFLKLSQSELAKRLYEKHKKSTRQILRYLSDFKKTEMKSPVNGREGLIPKKCTESIVRKDEVVIELCHPKNNEIVVDRIKIRKDKVYAPHIKKAVEKHYLTKRKPNIANLQAILEGMCQDSGLDPLDYDTVYNIVRRLNKKAVDILRNGDEAREKYELSQLGFVRIAKTPLHVVEIDHTRLDMILIDEKSGVTLERVWITMGIDVYTRKIWCLHISPDDPSANKTRKAIEHGLFFKNSKEKYGTLNEWEISGVPSIIYVDNGPDFTSADMHNLISEGLNIQIMFRPIKLPKYGALIERVFGTINKAFIHGLKGTTKSNPKELGEYDSEKEAIFSVNDITDLLTTYIVDVYHHQIHKGLPLNYPTPAAMFYHGIEVFGYPEFVTREEEETYRLKLLPRVSRAYNNKGIRFGNVRYWTKETSKFITSPSSIYTIKHDPDDISFIYLIDPNTGEYIQIYAQDPSTDELRGINRKTYNLLRSLLAEQGIENIGNIPGSKNLKLAKKLLREKLNKFVKKNKAARKQALKAGLTITTVDTDSLSSPPKGISSGILDLAEKLNFEKKKIKDEASDEK
jgi:putative transposase